MHSSIKKILSLIIFTTIYTHGLPGPYGDDDKISTPFDFAASSLDNSDVESPAIALDNDDSSIEISAVVGSECASNKEAKSMCPPRPNPATSKDDDFFPKYHSDTQYDLAIPSELDKYKCTSGENGGYVVCDSGDPADRLAKSYGYYYLRNCDRGIRSP